MNTLAKLRQSYGLSQTECAKLLGYTHKSKISKAENIHTSLRYELALKHLTEAISLTSAKIEAMQLDPNFFLIARKKGFVRRIYSNNQKAIQVLALLLNRKVNCRKRALYQYEVVVF